MDSILQQITDWLKEMLVSLGNGLRMSLARNKTSANRLDIIYDAGLDLYNMRFYRRPFLFLRFCVVFIISKIDKVCVKFSFLTETLTLPRYDGDRKSERMMKNELREKGCGADRAADGRSRHAVLRRLAGRGGDGTEQSDQIMSCLLYTSRCV